MKPISISILPMSAPQSDKVAAKLVYTTPLNGVRPCIYLNADPVTGIRERRYNQEEKDVEIENVRGKEHSVTLDTAGFQFYRAPSNHTSFANDEVIKKEYYPESIQLIENLTGATRVVLFDHSTNFPSEFFDILPDCHFFTSNS